MSSTPTSAATRVSPCSAAADSIHIVLAYDPRRFVSTLTAIAEGAIDGLDGVGHASTSLSRPDRDAKRGGRRR
ncbi:hypothetical protein AWC01_03760 [Mycobacterium doricum]|uniref:Uncharacterized protein n=1 Tax=Mycolicibacterium doricum TaxID=126673 RepID=A0A1X1TIR8_9MYCO|nr:hypothetical protein AWC01_03760 [Mycolicibacterium doricum]